jgi:hypothetical protein
MNQEKLRINPAGREYADYDDFFATGKPGDTHKIRKTTMQPEKILQIDEVVGPGMVRVVGWRDGEVLPSALYRREF